jgi:hypothetical protein
MWASLYGSPCVSPGIGTNLKDDGRGRWQGGPNWPRNGLIARSAAAAAHERLWIGSQTQTGSKPSSLPSLGMLISGLTVCRSQCGRCLTSARRSVRGQLQSNG